ncbi:MAG: 4-hydroxythreonine-4-phosphate dehydrogenase [Hyphomicrobiaceae bacterium]
MKPRLALSCGDPAGIGPEITVMAAARPEIVRACDLVVYGDERALARAREVCRIRPQAPTAIRETIGVSRLRKTANWWKPSVTAGQAAFSALDRAARDVMAGHADALVTAPLSKYWIDQAGHHYDGHTGFLSELAGCDAVMMLTGKRLRVVLVTTHIALADVPKRLTCDGIVRAAVTAADHLRDRHDIAKPCLAVAALNPHAGEGGLFGDEESRLIAPAITKLKRRGIDARGPFPADTLFAAAANGQYDAVICMYHDQALIPLKLLEFGQSVNVSMGLPFIRTSPDHGTAYDIAGTGSADPGSLVAAIRLAAAMARKSPLKSL